MADEIYAYTHPTDTAANWAAGDRVLALGEVGYDSTNNQLRAGNGVDLWSALPPIAANASGTVDQTARDLAQSALNAATAKYTKPGAGIPDTDLASTFIKTVNGNQPDTSGNIVVSGGGGGGAVSSVAGKTGDVTLNKTDVGLSNVTNTADADKPVSAAQATAIGAKYAKPSDGIPKTDLASGVQTSLGKADTALQSAPVTSVAGKTGTVSLAKGDVGLGNVDNTSDANKPVSTAQAAAIAATMQGRYRPESYGAVADGLTDDAAAFNAATTAIAQAGGGTLWLTPGKTYWVSAAVILSSNTVVAGNGAKITKRQASASRCVFANKSAANAVGYGAGGRNIVIRDLAFVGDFTLPKANYQDIATGWNHVDNLAFENCSFEQGMNNSHYIDLLGCTNVRVSNCRFLGMNPNDSREYLEAIQIDVSTRSATSYDDETLSAYDGLPTRGVLVEGCFFGNITVAGTVYGAPNPIGMHSAGLTDDTGYYQDIRFVNNLYQGWTTPATNDTFGLLHFRGISGVHVSGNTFNYVGSGGSGYPTVISVIPVTSVTPADQAQAASPTNVTLSTPRGSRNVTITGNRFIGWAAAPTRATSSLVNLNTVAGAVVSDNTFDGASASVVSALSSRVVVSDNDIVTNSTQPAVLLTSCTESTVQNNQVIGYAGGTNIQTDLGRNIRVGHNTMSGGATGIRMNGADGSSIQDNYVDGFTSTGVSVGDANYSAVHFDCIISVNRIRTATASTTSLSIGATSRRARRVYNVLRDPGVVVDNGTGTTGGTTDALS